MSVELFKIQNYHNTRKVLKKFKGQLNLRSWKKVVEKRSWKVMEFEELKRVRTLLKAEILIKRKLKLSLSLFH